VGELQSAPGSLGLVLGNERQTFLQVSPPQLQHVCQKTGRHLLEHLLMVGKSPPCQLLQNLLHHEQVALPRPLTDTPHALEVGCVGKGSSNILANRLAHS